jgi:hypothetical protein
MDRCRSGCLGIEPVRQFEIGRKRKANRNEGKIKPLKMLERGEIRC